MDAKVFELWKFIERARWRVHAGLAVEFDEQMSVSREDKRHIETLTLAIQLGLFKSVFRSG